MEEKILFANPAGWDKLGVMGSVIAIWRARRSDPEGQAESLSWVGRLAEAMQALRERCGGGPVPAMTPLITARRSEGLPEIPPIRRFDGPVAGNLLVSFDLFRRETAETGAGLIALPDQDQAWAEAKELGLPLVEERNQRFVRLERARLRGLDFRIFDPRDLYPGSDRMGFVFLNETGWPALDGLVVDVADRAQVAESGFAAVRQSDLYFSLPYLHLRYFLEGWCPSWFAWLRHYLLPGLEYSAYETNERFDELEEAFSGLDDAISRGRAVEMVFAKLLDELEVEVLKWTGDLARWAAEESPGKNAF